MDKYNICFIKPEDYEHSAAFSELGELLYYSLQDLGYEVVTNINKIELGFKNIVIGFHLLSIRAIQSLPDSTIVFNTEQIYEDDFPNAQKIYNFAAKFELWDYSKRNIKKFKELGFQNIKLFNIGFQKELVRLDLFRPKDFDILFYGSVNERRKNILDSLLSAGVKIKILYGVYGRERDDYIERSKIVLNLHYYNSHIFEVVRVFYLLTNSVAVVGEVNESTYIDPLYKEGIVTSCYSDLVSNCLALINDDIFRNETQLKAYQSIARFPQKKFTESVLR
jgi:hypothetical protein